MKTKFRLLALVMVMVMLLLLSGCSSKSENLNDGSNVTDESSIVPDDVGFAESEDDIFTNRDLDNSYSENSAIKIELKNTTAVSSSNKVKIDGEKITLREEATYIVSGNLDNGMIIVDADEKAKLQIVLDSASITSKTSAALYILNADKVFVTLAKNSKNFLSNGGEFKAIDDNNIDGAVFSKQDLTFNGEGTLEISSPVSHGIVCKDDLVLASGNYTINSAAHAIDVNDSVRGKSAILKLDAGKDGIHCENSDDTSKGFVYISDGEYNIEAEGDGISAVAYLQIEGGKFNLTTGGGSQNGSRQSSEGYGGFKGNRPGELTDNSTTSDSESMKGLKASGNLKISSGNITVNSADDSIHSNKSIYVLNGNFELSSGDDAIHAEEDLTISNGIVLITESYEGLEALNVKVMGGNIKLSANDDGINAAGGTDQSGFGGRDDKNFGGPQGRMGGPGGHGGMSAGNGSIVISGGEVYIKASGDGIDANGTLEISGGKVTVCGPTQGDTATLDYDTSGVITGGTFVGTGSSNMAQSFSSSENQGVIAVNAGSQAANTKITVKDSKGNTVLSATPELSYSVIILSSPKILKGETYTIYVGELSGEFEAS